MTFLERAKVNIRTTTPAIEELRPAVDFVKGKGSKNIQRMSIVALAFDLERIYTGFEETGNAPFGADAVNNTPPVQGRNCCEAFGCSGQCMMGSSHFSDPNRAYFLSQTPSDSRKERVGRCCRRLDRCVIQYDENVRPMAI